jgi:cytoplasmic iron level regulating protein YaaA (DUF328/UPF0246 family)
LFTKTRAYVETRGLDWRILSALHGLVRPDDVLEPYNVTLNTMPRTKRLEWGERVATQIANLAPAGSHLVFFAGNTYRTPLTPYLSAYRISAPLTGLGIGQQLAWFVSASKTHTQEDFFTCATS